MKSFIKPEFFNGTELIAELKTANVNINGKPEIDGNGILWLDVTDEVKTQEVLKNHNGTVIAPDLSTSRQAILDRLGLTAEEAQLLLGGN
jgi:hypothetical protein